VFDWNHSFAFAISDMCGLVVKVACTSSDREVAGLTPSRGTATWAQQPWASYIHVPLFSKQFNLVLVIGRQSSAAWKVWLRTGCALRTQSSIHLRARQP